MADKKTIQNIKTRIERTVQGLKTKSNEFKFKDTDTFVREGTTYSIYYTLNKDKVYLTGLISSTQSRMIEKINEDEFQKSKKCRISILFTNKWTTLSTIIASKTKGIDFQSFCV